MSTKSENLRAWIAALRSGKYAQGQAYLRCGGNYCCLGVAYDLSEGAKWVPSREEDADGVFETLDGFVGGLVEQTRAQFGLTEEDALALVLMNDSERIPFTQIADYIETNILPRVEAEEKVTA